MTLTFPLVSSEADVWRDFYVMTGGAAAALTGLILVAVSLHLREILRHPLHRDRAFTSLQGLVTLLLVAAIVLTPQSLVGAGIETIVLGIYWVVRYIRFVGLFRGVRSGRGAASGTTRVGMWAAEWVLWLAWVALFSVAGALLVTADGRGFYLLALSTALGFVLIVWNAWVLLAEVAE